MENTECGDKCAFVKNGMCADCSSCPNYIESWWTQQGAAQPKLVKDCAPKRMMLQQQYLQLRVEQLTADLCDARVQYTRVAQHLEQIINLSRSDTNLMQIESATKLEQLDEKTKPSYLECDPPNTTLLHAD